MQFEFVWVWPEMFFGMKYTQSTVPGLEIVCSGLSWIKLIYFKGTFLF